jgi:hypothetical protein
MTFWRYFKTFMICPNAKIKIKEQACKVKPQLQTTHLHVLMMTSWPRMMREEKSKAKNEDFGFEQDKPSTSEDQVASVPSEECLTSEEHTDPLVISPMDQQHKKSMSGDPVGKPVQPVSKTGLIDFHKMNAVKGNKHSRR